MRDYQTAIWWELGRYTDIRTAGLSAVFTAPQSISRSWVNGGNYGPSAGIKHAPRTRERVYRTLAHRGELISYVELLIFRLNP